jgi:hypothetical protein
LLCNIAAPLSAPSRERGNKTIITQESKKHEPNKFALRRVFGTKRPVEIVWGSGQIVYWLSGCADFHDTVWLVLFCSTRPVISGMLGEHDLAIGFAGDSLQTWKQFSKLAP